MALGFGRAGRWVERGRSFRIRDQIRDNIDQGAAVRLIKTTGFAAFVAYLGQSLLERTTPGMAETLESSAAKLLVPVRLVLVVSLVNLLESEAARPGLDN